MANDAKALAAASLVALGFTAGVIAPRGLNGGQAVLSALVGLMAGGTGLAIATKERLTPGDYLEGAQYAISSVDKVIAPGIEKVSVKYLAPELVRGKSDSAWSTAIGRLTQYSSGVLASPNSGKTHTMHLMVEEVYRRCPSAHVRIFDRHNGKRDLNWFGLPVGSVVFAEMPDLLPLIEEFHAAIGREDTSQEMHLFIPELASSLGRFGDARDRAASMLADIVEEGHGFKIFLHLDMQTSAVGRTGIPEGIKSSVWWIAVQPTTVDHLKQMKSRGSHDLIGQCQQLKAAGKRPAVVLTAYGVDVVEIPDRPLGELDIPTEDPIRGWVAGLDWQNWSLYESASKAWDEVCLLSDLPDGFNKAKRKSGQRANPWYVEFSKAYELNFTTLEETAAYAF